MITGALKYVKNYKYLEESILECLLYAKENDLVNFDTACYKIDGDRLFVNIVEYETQNREDRFWEAHKKYVDLHLMLRGKEIIDINFIDNLKIKDYEEESDFLPLEGEQSAYVTLEDNDFLVCYPEDAHRTAIKVGGQEKIKKAIFKIKV
ncbi:MAG: YhcH/YjgK/YiaL family protein [Sarcina sp.]